MVRPSGEYATDGVELSMQNILATKLVCDDPPGIMSQEARFLELLEEAEEYRINSDGELEITRFVIENDEEVEQIILLLREK